MSKTILTSIRFTPEFRKKLKEAANICNKSMNSFIVECLEDRLKELEKDIGFRVALACKLGDSDEE